MSEIALRQKLRTAEESADEWRRKFEHADQQRRHAWERTLQAEAALRGLADMYAALKTARCSCDACEHRERGLT